VAGGFFDHVGQGVSEAEGHVEAAGHVVEGGGGGDFAGAGALALVVRDDRGEGVAGADREVALGVLLGPGPLGVRACEVDGEPEAFHAGEVLDEPAGVNSVEGIECPKA
jgi:hypothetical protein